MPDLAAATDAPQLNPVHPYTHAHTLNHPPVSLIQVDPPPVLMPAPLEGLLRAMQVQEEEADEGAYVCVKRVGCVDLGVVAGVKLMMTHTTGTGGEEGGGAGGGGAPVWSAALQQELEARAYRLYLEEGA